MASFLSACPEQILVAIVGVHQLFMTDYIQLLVCLQIPASRGYDSMTIIATIIIYWLVSKPCISGN